MNKLFNSKLERFIAKRALIICVVVSALNFIFFRSKVLLLAGIPTGLIFSLLRLNTYITAFSRLFSRERDASAASRSIIIRFIVNSILTIIVLVASLNYSQSFFAGVVEGILLIPLVITINGITEATGITHNNFE